VVLPVAEVRMLHQILLSIRQPAVNTNRKVSFVGLASNFHLEALNWFVAVYQRLLCAINSFFYIERNACPSLSFFACPF